MCSDRFTQVVSNRRGSMIGVASQIPPKGGKSSGRPNTNAPATTTVNCRVKRQMPLTAASMEIAQPHHSWHNNDDDAAFGNPMDSCITPKSPALLLNPAAHLNCTPLPLAASLDARLEYRLSPTSTQEAIQEKAQPETIWGPGCCASTQQANFLMFAMQVSLHVIVRVLLPALTAASMEIAQPHHSWHTNDDDAAFGIRWIPASHPSRRHCC
ncbi:hypothetical protein MRX96_008130 [Rhipicephalus microplus]